MKLPKLWRVKRAGKEIGAWHVTVGGLRVNLGTQDAEKARQRRVEAVKSKGKKKFRGDVEGAAEGVIAALEAASSDSDPGAKDSPAPAATSAPAMGSTNQSDGGAVGGHGNSTSEQPYLSPSVQQAPPPDHGARPASGDWHANLAAAASATSAPPTPEPPPPPEVSDDDLADIGIGAQVWVAQWRARRKVYKGFQAPPLTPEQRAALADPWKTIIAYANIGAVLPPWVRGVVIPGVTLLIATGGMVSMFCDLAEQQRKAAGAPEQTKPEAPPAAAAA